MTKLTIKTTLMIFLMASGINAQAATANKDRVNETLEKLRLAINAHDYSMLKPSLDDDFTYEGRGSMMSTMIMRQVISGYPQEVSAITVISITPLEEGWDVAVRLEGKEPSKQRVISLTRNYIIRQADIADVQMVGHD